MAATTSQTERKLSDFEGAWHLSRQITHDGAPPASFRGLATWTPHAGGLQYEEQGTLHIMGQPPMSSSRRYFWQADLSVLFDDGRYFHTVPVTGGHTAHWCDPDHYAVTYHFNHWPKFTVDWRVEGPRKSYQMLSEYVPKGQGVR